MVEFIGIIKERNLVMITSKHYHNSPYGLLTNLSSAPLGVNLRPMFSWILNSEKKNDHQTAYRIILSDNMADITSDHGNVWDSGKIYSDNSSTVPYEGPELLFNSVYYWKVCTYDKDGIQSQFSGYQKISTEIKDWAAKPIWCANDPDMIFIRKDFNVEKEPESAIASVFASSTEGARQYVFDFKVNGVFIGQGPVKPHNSKYLYSTFDITNVINTGINTVSSLLYTRQDRIYMCQIQIKYTDGTEEIIYTDDTWSAMDATEVFGLKRDIGTHYYKYPAEDINAKLYPYGYDKAGYINSSFKAATVKDTKDITLAPDITERVKRYYKCPESVIRTDDNGYLIDLGKEIIGGLKLIINVPDEYDGHVIRVLCGEEMEDEYNVKYRLRTSNVYEEFWTLKAGYQEIENFGMKCFRYVNIFNCPIDLTTDNFKSVSYRQFADKNDSFFESSSFLLNDIYDFVKYSITVTSQDLYTDSQSRERKNYEGDAFINQLSQYALQRSYALPRLSAEDLYYCPTWPFEYKQMSIMMALNDFLHTGNIESLKVNYEILKTKVVCGNNDPTNYLDEEIGLIFNTTKNNSENANLVDWPMSERDSYDFANAFYNTVTNAFHYKAYDCLVQIARALDIKEDEVKYTLLANRIKESMLQHLIDPATGLFVDGLDQDGKRLDHSSQHANAFPLALGVVTDKTLKERITAFINDRGLQTSVYGAQFVLDALYAADKGNIALKILTARNMRSWYHLIYDLGSTVCTEAWDPKNKPNMTFSHPWSSSPANVIAYGLFGIKPLKPGFSEFMIKMQPGDLEYCRIKTPTIKGSIEVEYNVNIIGDGETEICVNTIIPVNTKAKLYIPSQDSNGRLLVDGQDSMFKYADGYVVIQPLGSGAHHIVLKQK